MDEKETKIINHGVEHPKNVDITEVAGSEKASSSNNEKDVIPVTGVDIESAQVLPGGVINLTTDTEENILQEGVRRSEVVTTLWGKKSLAAVFISIWFIYLVQAFQASVTANLVPYVLSDFSAHSLVATIAIVGNVVPGAFRLCISRVLDLFGRAYGIIVMVCIAILGLILMASTQGVTTYAAAVIFYYVGFDGLIYTCDVITADSSSLKSRALAFAFTASPYIISAYAGPTIAEYFYERISWRWAFGMWTIILPIVASPLLLILLHFEAKGKKAGLIKPRNSGRTWFQSVKYYVIEFDVLGVTLLAAGFAMFLLPFGLAGDAEDKWKTPYIIALLVLGVCTLIAFVLVERYVVPKSFLPFQVLLSRTVMGTVLLATTYQIAYYCWNSYFTSYLQVVHFLGIKEAGYVASVFDVTSGICNIIMGFIIRRYGHFKPILLGCVALIVLGTGLMIYFRQPQWSVGYLIMCQVMTSLAGGTIILLNQIAITSTANHSQVAACLALLGLFSYIGGAIGNSISGAVWTNTFPQSLERFLPDYAQENLTAIYGDLEIQTSYGRDDPVRNGIIAAYGVAQRNMLIAGTSVMSLGFIWVMLMRNVNIKNVKQVKGTVL